MVNAAKVPKATITRLSIYYRQLESLEFDGYRKVSSEKLGWLCQVHPAQVRKDLGYFGEFGVRGVGYDVIELQREIKRILAVNREWNMCIVGMGNLGCALLQRQYFLDRGFKCVAVFDNSPEKIGINTSSGLKIRDTKELINIVRGLEIKIGVITTPAYAAQNAADLLLEAGVNAILNFSPTQVVVPETCLVENIDFTVKLDLLTYALYKEKLV